ncbi:DGQHR domain-containing protein [Virgibacillus halodenitrificans]|uniref:DNA sulfur modification protein DndB n=1 Tax=Virgibacillus halodenitrificans TaxID=1482 RepID=UPI001FB3F3E3|nr:DNA sulfur modification protein DndB [Virgibacillus halodenitrificans]MCJ0931910.1 DGQHR domain-containing protein [Virgibacillus halodenitrificans]
MGNLEIQGSIASPDNKKAIMTTQIKIEDILQFYEIDKSVNRDLGYHRMPKLVSYFDSMYSESGIFLPALVFSFREDPNPYWNGERNTLTLPQESKLIVLDGQHRIKGLERYLERDKVSEEKRVHILDSYLTAQIYFGLSFEEERKLFTDINTNAKRVSRSLITKFDNRDILNVLTRELYNSSKTLRTSLTIEFEKARIVRPNNITFTTSVRLKRFIKILLFGENILSGRPPVLNKREDQLVRENYDKVFSFLDKFFFVLGEVLPEEPGNVKEYVLGHEPIQNAIALYLQDAIITNCNSDLEWLESWEDDVEQLQVINWSVKNRLWKPYMTVSKKGTPFEYLAFNNVHSDTVALKEIIDQKVNSVG